MLFFVGVVLGLDSGCSRFTSLWFHEASGALVGAVVARSGCFDSIGANSSSADEARETGLE